MAGTSESRREACAVGSWVEVRQNMVERMPGKLGQDCVVC